VAEFEVRLRVGDSSGAWRLVVSSPTGEPDLFLRNLLYAVITAPTVMSDRSGTSQHNPVEPCLCWNPSAGELFQRVYTPGSTCSRDSF